MDEKLDAFFFQMLRRLPLLPPILKDVVFDVIPLRALFLFGGERRRERRDSTFPFNGVWGSSWSKKRREKKT